MHKKTCLKDSLNHTQIWNFQLETFSHLYNRVKADVKTLLIKGKSKAIPVTGSGGLQGCEMLRISHCLDNQQTDGSYAPAALYSP
jgi:hypothetical protein